MSYVPYAASIVYGVYAIYPYVPTTIVWNYVVSPLSYRFIKQVGKMYQSKTVRDEEINDKDDEIVGFNVVCSHLPFYGNSYV